MRTQAVSRRTALTGLLGLGAGAVTLAACGAGAQPVGPGAIAAAATARTGPGRDRPYQLRARRTQVDLGGKVVDTWTYGESVPGPVIRANAGDRVQIAFTNDLPQETSVHWHGLAIRNDMDGVPGLTTPPVAPGASFGFDFVVPDPGTHWFHPHTGLPLDYGLYAPFIVDDPGEAAAYDAAWNVVLDDWTHGVGPTPEQILATLKDSGSQGGMGGMDHGSGGGMGGGGGGDVQYPLYLVNGRAPTDPDVLRARPGQRVRLRIINAGADTVFDVALGGHDLLVTHSDGYPVEPVSASSLRISMGERYDAVVTLSDGVFPLVAQPVGKSGTARALVRTGAGAVPAQSYRPRELDGRVLTVDRLRAGPGAALPSGTPDSTQDLILSGSMSGYVWTINGRTYDRVQPLTVRQGQSTRLRIRNRSMMTHPLHVHGHTFQLGSAGGTGPRKDTVLVPSMGGVDVDLLADNPGRWMIHCHNAYHMEGGMMSQLDYVT